MASLQLSPRCGVLFEYASLFETYIQPNLLPSFKKLSVFLTLLLFVSITTHAKVLKNEVVGRSFKNFSLKDVCEHLGHKHLLMVSPVENHSVDCMGKAERISTFCEKKFPKSKTLLRGIVDPLEKGRVLCEFGSNVRLKISCQGKTGVLCKRPKSACENLKSFYALKLSMIRSSQGEDVLNCLYGND